MDGPKFGLQSKSIEATEILMISKPGIPLIAMLLIAFDTVAGTDLCDVEGKNLIQDPSFSVQESGGNWVHWIVTQHAGERSYEYTIEKGVLSVTRIGAQPGFLFKQRIDISRHKGRKLAFYSELEFDLTVAPATLRLTPPGGGLSISAWSGKGGRGKLLMDASLLNEPKLGKMEWHPVQIVVALPEETRSLDVGFRLEADGVLSARNPRLQYVNESEKPCEVTPGINLIKAKKSALR